MRTLFLLGLLSACGGATTTPDNESYACRALVTPCSEASDCPPPDAGYSVACSSACPGRLACEYSPIDGGAL